MKIFIAQHSKDLPPVQSDAIEKLTSALFKGLINPTITLRMAGKLVNADKPALQEATPLSVNFGPGKTKVDDKVPSLSAPITAVCDVLGMQKQNLHTVWKLQAAMTRIRINRSGLLRQSCKRAPTIMPSLTSAFTSCVNGQRKSDFTRETSNGGTRTIGALERRCAYKRRWDDLFANCLRPSESLLGDIYAQISVRSTARAVANKIR